MSRYEWTSISESYRQNARRHEQRAQMHIADGRPDWARGSLAKAARNVDRANRLDEMMRLPPALERIANRLAQHIAADIYG